MEFSDDPEAGLDDEQRALIGPNDLKIVVIHPRTPDEPRLEVTSLHGQIVKELTDTSLDDLLRITLPTGEAKPAQPGRWAGLLRQPS
jgi:hypothetical protein